MRLQNSSLNGSNKSFFQFFIEKSHLSVSLQENLLFQGCRHCTRITLMTILDHVVKECSRDQEVHFETALGFEQTVIRVISLMSNGLNLEELIFNFLSIFLTFMTRNQPSKTS